ncbi:MAG: PEP-CTERM sorting domain-containing protein, partial [Vicinamibacterales bacterium]
VYTRDLKPMMKRSAMRRLVFGAMLTLAIPTLTTAAPICTTGTLAEYVALGSGGCMVGSALFADFGTSVLNPLATAIEPGEISVAPLITGSTVGLAFLLDATAGAGELLDVLIRYEVTGLNGLSFIANSLSMSGSAVDPDGVVTAVEEKCAGGNFQGPDPSTVCAGNTVGPLIVFDIGLDSDLLESAFLSSPASFFDVFTEIAIDGGLDGQAALGIVTNEFDFTPTQTVIPEPATLLLLSSGLAGAFVRRRRRRS